MHQPGLEPGTNDLKDRYSAIELLVQKPIQEFLVAKLLPEFHSS